MVGGDYGTTTGNVYTSFLNQNSTSESVLGSSDQQHQIITKNTECSMLNFSVYSNESHDTLFLTTQETPIYKSAEDHFKDHIECHRQHGFICDIIKANPKLRKIPLFVLIDLLPCPPGFILSRDPSGCQCHPVLTANGVDCILNHLNGYHSWNSTNIWIQAVDNNEHNFKALLFSTHCPFSYCKPDDKHINLSNSDTQCA